MRYFSDYRFTAGFISIISGLLALVCIITGAMAVQNNFDAFSNPVLTLNYAHNYQLAKWFNLFDLFGYYLLLLPLVFYYHHQYKYSSPWTTLISFCGLAYVLTGALGASILTAVWPDMMQDYLAASVNDKTMITALFKTTTLVVTKGMWNILEVLFASVWWIGLGRMILREHKLTGVVTILTGISTLLDAAGNMINVNILADLGLNLYLVLGILWPVLIGATLIRQSISHQSFALHSKRSSTFQYPMHKQVHEISK